MKILVILFLILTYCKCEDGSEPEEEISDKIHGRFGRKTEVKTTQNDHSYMKPNLDSTNAYRNVQNIQPEVNNIYVEPTQITNQNHQQNYNAQHQVQNSLPPLPNQVMLNNQQLAILLAQNKNPYLLGLEEKIRENKQNQNQNSNKNNGAEIQHQYPLVQQQQPIEHSSQYQHQYQHQYQLPQQVSIPQQATIPQQPPPKVMYQFQYLPQTQTNIPAPHYEQNVNYGQNAQQTQIPVYPVHNNIQDIQSNQILSQFHNNAQYGIQPEPYPIPSAPIVSPRYTQLPSSSFPVPHTQSAQIPSTPLPSTQYTQSVPYHQQNQFAYISQQNIQQQQQPFQYYPANNYNPTNFVPQNGQTNQIPYQQTFVNDMNFNKGLNQGTSFLYNNNGIDIRNGQDNNYYPQGTQQSPNIPDDQNVKYS